MSHRICFILFIQLHNQANYPPFLKRWQVRVLVIFFILNIKQSIKLIYKFETYFLYRMMHQMWKVNNLADSLT